MVLSQEMLENIQRRDLDSSVKCHSIGECCFRLENGACKALSNTRFPDGQCRFRKKSEDGPNLYEKEKDIKRRASGSQVREFIALLREDGLTVKMISQAVGLSEATVRRHLSLMNIEE